MLLLLAAGCSGRKQPSSSHPPTLTASPADGATEVALGTNVILTSSEPLDPASVTAANITLQDTTGNAVPVTPSLSPDGLKVTLPAPAGGFTEHTTYILTASTHVTAISTAGGLPLAATFTARFTTGGTPPLITNLVPADGATGVSPTPTITVTFSERVRDVTPSAISLQTGGTPVASTVSFDTSGRIATLTPSAPLLDNTSYSVVIGPALTDADDSSPLAGAPITAGRFTTGVFPPTVVGISPADGAIGVNGNVAVQLTFSEALLTSTVDPATITLADSSGNAVATQVTLDSTGKGVTLQPTSNLQPSTRYTVTATTGVQNTRGIALASAASASFTTAAGPTITGITPADGATGVPRTTAVTITFSSPVTGVSGTTFTVTARGGPAISGTVTPGNGGTTATFTPNAPLAEFTSYNVALSPEVADANGNRIAPVAAGFTTLGMPPRLTDATLSYGTTSQPLDLTGATWPTNVPLANDTIVATFEHAMDPTATPAAIQVLDPAGNAVPTTTVVSNSGTASSGSATVTTTIPALNLEQTGYTYRIGAGAKSLAGVAVPAAVDLKLVTEPRPRFWIIPRDFSTGVPTNSGIFVLFNKPMNPSTVTSNVSMSAAAPGSPAASQAIAVTMDPTHTIATVGLRNSLGQLTSMSSGTRYSLRIGGGITDANGNTYGRAEVHTWDAGSAIDSNLPAFKVSSTSPANGASGVDPSTLTCSGNAKGIRIFFNKAIDPSTAQGAVTLSPSSGSPIAGTTTVGSANELDFCPATPLGPDTYQVTVASNLKSATGSTLPTTASSTFTTAPAAAPTVAGLAVSTGPGSSAGTNTAIQLRFSGPILPATLQVALTAIAGGTRSTVAASTAYDATTHSAVVTPSAALPASSQVNVTVAAGLQNPGGMATSADMLAGSFSVGTGADTTAPTATLFAPASTHAPANTPVVVNFNKNMNPLTLEPLGAVKLVDGSGNAVPATLSPAGSTSAALTCPPGVYLAAGQTYHVQLAPGVADLAGNAVSNGPLSFTVDNTAPTLASTNLASGQLGPTSPLLASFNGTLNGKTASVANVTVTDNTAGASVLAAVEEVGSPSPGISTIEVYPGSQWLAGHLYTVNFGTGVQEVGGLGLASAIPLSVSASTGPSIVAALFAPDDGTGKPLGGFGPGCSGFTAQNAILDLTQLPGATSGNSCQSPLGLANMPLWLLFSGPLNAASATTASNYLLQRTTPVGPGTVTVAPTYASNTLGSYVKLPPPGGNWLPSSTAYPTYAQYILTVLNVQDQSNTPMSAASSFAFRTVTLSFIEAPGITHLQDPGYTTNLQTNAQTPHDVWAWQPSTVKVLPGPASWLTDPSDMFYQRDCQAAPATGMLAAMTLDTPNHGWGSSPPTTDILLRVKHMYGYNPGAGDTLAISANPTGGSAWPLYGLGAPYPSPSTGQSPDYSAYTYTFEELSLLQQANLFGGPSALPALSGVRFHFGLDVAGAQTTATHACPATDMGWIIQSYAVVAY